jgi:hypothetical protein
MTRVTTLLLVVMPATATVGCAAWEVKRTFVLDAVCPSDRVTVTQAGVVVGGPPPPAPPEIAADPERLAVYYVKTRNPDEGDRLFVAEGCGERRWYTCDHGGAGGPPGCARAAPPPARVPYDPAPSEMRSPDNIP